MEEIENKVAKSGLVTLELEELKPNWNIVGFDMKDVLWQGLALKEKDFRDFVKTNNWSAFESKSVFIFSSVDAIIPTWAFMLLSASLTEYCETVVVGKKEDLELVLWRNKNKEAFQKKHGDKVTFMPIITEAVATALSEFPLVNSSVSGDKIIMKRDINVGIAVAKPDGNLIVPVIKNADQLNLVGMTKKVNDLANRARTNKLNPDDIQGGTYTVTNVGTFGSIMGTPIINQPQVAILACGIIKKKPVVLETAEGDVIAIRHMMFLSLSYDHRVVDGALGGQFVRRVADYLEQFDTNTIV